MKNQKNKWFAFVQDKPEYTYKILCFPYAGAGASIFASWGKFFSAQEFGLYPVQYPHRESRIREEMIYNIREMAQELVQSDETFFRENKIILYGKCLGSLTAFAVAAYMEQTLGVKPVLLVSSSGASPEFMKLESPQNFDNEQEMQQLLLKYDFITQEQMTDPMFSGFYLPVLKGDYQMQAMFQDSPENTISCNILFLQGTEEVYPQQAMISGWGKRTTGHFTKTILSGGHYFESPSTIPEVLAVIRKELQ